MFTTSLLTILLMCTLTPLTTALPPQLLHIANIQFNIGQPRSQNLPTGTFLFVAIESGTFNTTSSAPTPLQASILPGGNDHAQLAPDGSYRLDVHAAAEGTAGEGLFYLESYGYVAPGATVQAGASVQPGALMRPSESVPDFGTLDAWQVVKVRTDAPGFEWLDTAALVAQERAWPGEGRVELRVWWVRVAP